MAGSGEVEAQEAGLAETVGSVVEAGGQVMAGTREEVVTGVAASEVVEAAVIKVWYSVVFVLFVTKKIICMVRVS